MTNWLTAGRVEDLDQRLHEAAEGLIIDLGHSKEATSLLAKEDQLEEVLFDAEVLCEEHALNADYRAIDILTMIAISDEAVFLIDDSLESGENPNG